MFVKYAGLLVSLQIESENREEKVPPAVPWMACEYRCHGRVPVRDDEIRRVQIHQGGKQVEKAGSFHNGEGEGMGEIEDLK